MLKSKISLCTNTENYFEYFNMNDTVCIFAFATARRKTQQISLPAKGGNMFCTFLFTTYYDIFYHVVITLPIGGTCS